MIFIFLSALFANPRTLTIHFWKAETFKNSRNGLDQAFFRSKDCTSPPIGWGPSNIQNCPLKRWQLQLADDAHGQEEMVRII